MGASARTAVRPAAPARARLRARVHIAWLQLAMLASVLAALPFVTKVDPDYWWHWRTGEAIVRDGLPAAERWAEKILAVGPLAAQSAKKAMLIGTGMPLEEGLRYELTLFQELLAGTEDAREGMSAFVEKRKPEWKGR